MLRSEAAMLYTVDLDGWITTPGIFYKERFCVPHFWGKVQERKVRHEETCKSGFVWDICQVTKEDRREYPELHNIASVGVRKDKEGNVLSWFRGWSYQPGK